MPRRKIFALYLASLAGCANARWGRHAAGASSGRKARRTSVVLLASACCRDGAAPLLLIFPWGVDHSRGGALPSGNGRGWDGADRYLFSLLTGKQTTRVGTHFDHHPRDRVLDP